MAGGAVAARYATLGYRGHPITKARRYSTSSGSSAAPAPGAGPRRSTEPTDDAYTVREALREANPDDPLPHHLPGLDVRRLRLLALDTAERNR